jgi:hypothetical protein
MTRPFLRIDSMGLVAPSTTACHLPTVTTTAHPPRVRRLRRASHVLALLVLSLGATSLPVDAQVARNVLVVTLDGLRWQEFFTGANRDYFERDRDGNAGEPEKRFWRQTPVERRAALMPFLWDSVAAQGQVLGDPAAGSTCRLTNGLWFSYPGYSELLTGVADKRIDSNKKVPNPNVNVLEWLNGRPAFAGRVAAFGSWDVLPSILNVERSRLPVGNSFTPSLDPASERGRAINELASDLPRYWGYGPVDAPIVYAAIEHLRTKRPRVLYVLLGETDEFAHEGKYGLYLDAAYRADRFIARLWHEVQSLPDYAGQTALIVTTDHGRGDTTKDWQHHGEKVPAAERTWMAVMGPGVPSLGVRSAVQVTASQFAATIAALLGEDFRQAYPAAAAPIALAR